MASEPQIIRIESILGGQSSNSNFLSNNQFRTGQGINPTLPKGDSSSSPFDILSSGLIRPTGVTSVASPSNTVLWMVSDIKNANGAIFMYGALGSVYALDAALNIFYTNDDLNDGGNAHGNGMAYYDNYIYYSRDTTVARYGPLTSGTLNGSFTDDYWVSTLGLPALQNNYPTEAYDASYPLYPISASPYNDYSYPSHVLHRHSDGRLYIADIVDNKGTIHYIQTTKNTVEGDTNAGSTYNKVQVGYGLYPSAMESYGSQLAIAFFESRNAEVKGANAKVAFWDTSSQTVNQISWAEFPDAFISAIKNVNGVLYFFSTNIYKNGYRITRYVGGNTFQDVYVSPDGICPPSGAVITDGNNLYYGGASQIPVPAANVYMYDTQNDAVFPIIAPAADVATDPQVTSMIFATGPGTRQGIVSATSTPGIFKESVDYGTVDQYFWSKTYNLGGKFKIKKITIPLAQTISSGMEFKVSIYTDDGAGTKHSLVTVNNTTYPGANFVELRPENATGKYNFWLEFLFTGTILCTVALPITIEYEPLA